MAIMLTLCLLKVKGGDASVVFNLEGGNGVNSVPLTVSLAVNGGISGASVNIIYDYKKVKLAGWELFRWTTTASDSSALFSAPPTAMSGVRASCSG